ncbi:MAG: GNAT family N-acetyltransferase [Ornithinimicrobium sp.]
MADSTIRAALPDDFEGVAGVLEQPSEETRATAIRWIGSGGTLVAVRRGSIVGFSVTTPTFFGNDFIEMLQVRKDARRRGVASMLLDAASAQRCTEKMFTSTNLSNSPMQALLGHLRWESVGIVYGLDDADPELFYKASTR